MCEMCGSHIARLILTILNTMFAMIALVMLVLGCFALYGGDFLLSWVNPMLEELRANGIPNATLDQDGVNIYELFKDVAIPLIVCGALLFIIAFFGCCGVNCDRRSILAIYIVILSVVIAAQILAIVILASGQTTWKQQIIDRANAYMEKEYQGTNGTNVVSVVSNTVFMRFNCCTWGDYTLEEKEIRFNTSILFDMNRSEYWIPHKQVAAKGPIVIPFTCCVMDQPYPAVSPVDVNCASVPNDSNAYVTDTTTTCYAKVEKVLLQYETEAILGAVIVLLLQVIIVIMAVCVCQKQDSGVSSIV